MEFDKEKKGIYSFEIIAQRNRFGRFRNAFKLFKGFNEKDLNDNDICAVMVKLTLTKEEENKKILDEYNNKLDKND